MYFVGWAVEHTANFCYIIIWLEAANHETINEIGNDQAHLIFMAVIWSDLLNEFNVRIQEVIVMAMNELHDKTDFTFRIEQVITNLLIFQGSEFFLDLVKIRILHTDTHNAHTQQNDKRQ